LEISPDLAFLDRLSAEITDMAREGGKLHFRLTPAHLGKLDVAVEAHGDAVSVHMQTHSPEAKSILTDAQSGLMQDLAARGLRLGETTVSLAGDGNLPRRNQPQPEMMIETETPQEADAGSPITARSSGRFA
jgi:flagellar hook-length control protein FliK